MALGPLASSTPNFAFNLVNFDFIAWHEFEHENWTVVDALLAQVISINNISGQWANNTAYVAGDRVVDPDLGTIWECDIGHTSATTGTFQADRTANPTYWTSISPYVPIYKGAWTNNTAYIKSDFVSDGYTYRIANASHTSNAAGTITDDVANWDTLVDVDTVMDTKWADLLATFEASTHIVQDVQASAPGTPSTGHLWYDTTNRILKMYDGSTWEEVFRVIASASAPSSPEAGDQWFDTDTGITYIYYDSHWVQM